jgi:antitoxin ParD1/3/4
MTISLTPEQEKFVAEQIRSGHYHSAADVVTQGLGMLRAQEDFIRENAAELREMIAVGLDQIKRGETVDGGTAVENLREMLRRRERGGK